MYKMITPFISSTNHLIVLHICWVKTFTRHSNSNILDQDVQHTLTEGMQKENNWNYQNHLKVTNFMDVHCCKMLVVSKTCIKLKWIHYLYLKVSYESVGAVTHYIHLYIYIYILNRCI